MQKGENKPDVGIRRRNGGNTYIDIYNMCMNKCNVYVDNEELFLVL